MALGGSAERARRGAASAAELQVTSLRMEEKAADAPKSDWDPLKGVRLAEALRDLREERAPRSRFSARAPRARAARKARKEGAREPPALQRAPLKLQAPRALLRRRPGGSGQARRGLREKLSEALELRRPSLAKKRQGPRGRPSGGLARALARQRASAQLAAEQAARAARLSPGLLRSPTQALARRPRRPPPPPPRAAARAAWQPSKPP